MSRVWQDAYSVQLSYAQNMKALMPDHGFPLRVVIPGYIGGRMIKWLSRINIIPKESTNHYHFHDNRVLPPQVRSYDQSIAEQWWYKPEYIFNEVRVCEERQGAKRRAEKVASSSNAINTTPLRLATLRSSQLNINSAISSPDHDAEIDLSKNLTRDFLVQGYAYAGGGSPVNRVEVSLDEGATWLLTDINRPFPPNRHGMHWCWIFWSLPIPVARLSAAPSIICRAFDNHTNTQPINFTWNLMGMANNCCFRVKIHTVVDSAGNPKLKFEHPTLAGAQKGGWMTKDSGKPVSAGFGNLRKFLEEQEAAEEADAAAHPPAIGKEKDDLNGAKGYTMSEVRACNSGVHNVGYCF